MKGGRGKNIPDDDHVIRHVPWARLRRDEDDNVIGFLPQAFQLRPDEQYLSVNWMEYHDGDRDTQITSSIWGIRASFERPLGAKSAFGIASVTTIKDISQAAGTRVRITHEPDGDRNPGHAGIRQLPRDDLNLLEALAADAFVERVNNADIRGEPTTG